MAKQPRGFGLRLKELREDAGMTQADLAKKTGYSVQAIYQWESGLRKVSFEAACALADALAVSVEDLRTERPKADEGGAE